jgi:hypothetical protein
MVGPRRRAAGRACGTGSMLSSLSNAGLLTPYSLTILSPCALPVPSLCSLTVLSNCAHCHCLMLTAYAHSPCCLSHAHSLCSLSDAHSLCSLSLSLMPLPEAMLPRTLIPNYLTRTADAASHGASLSDDSHCLAGSRCSDLTGNLQ